ncbi:MAG: TrpB-like pyridoxal phosphate-dependent enzyme [Peptostreptococcaceae bacterium]|nr:TrpB-like pyridoxal phosphate-dependent enzyme [Peptostreptococcaceae bacterium]MDY5739829.1 TrpB-like pyridoxal phosphate-dependent enzyme [Anaerovoracaceae bacterium]
MEEKRIFLTEAEMPKYWYDMRADMKTKPAPLLNPITKEPVTFEELSMVFTRSGAREELNENTAFHKIPQPVLEYYKTYRPSPLVRANAFEKAIGTGAKIYFKFEGGNTSGSHKLNSAIAQCYYAKEEGIRGVTTETGAGQWGTALAMASSYLDLDCNVFMVKGSYEQKPYRKEVMKTFGAQVTPSPSLLTEIGKKINAQFPDTSGSLGCAISEAIEDAHKKGYKYVLGSVLNQVLLHQSIIGLEAEAAMKKANIKPDIIIGSAGGGSNIGGLIAPFVGKVLRGESNYRFIAAEPQTCPSLTKGEFRYDYCDTGKTTPMAKMYTLGCDFIPPLSHAGGLRYHGMNPVVSQLYADSILEAEAFSERDVFEAAKLFARKEGILPAPESGHAIAAVIKEAAKYTDTTKEPTILFCLSGVGYFDMSAYKKFN